MAGKRERARHAGGLIFVHVAGVVLTMLAGAWVATQWTASMLGYQPELGAGWCRILGYPVYAPWQYFAWLSDFNAYAPWVFNRGMIPIVAGTCLSIAAAVAISVWRARLVDLATTHGSARWATRGDVRSSGLADGNAGVVLGIADHGTYLTHDGPEHVSLIAPSRSGKGVGVVIPTMLNWTGSVVCNDIKRELWEETAGWRATFSRCLAFDPSARATARFNPLDEVRKGDFEIRDVQNITDMIVDPHGKGKPDHWSKEGDAYLVAVILHVLYAETDRTLAGVAYFLNDPARTLDETLSRMLHARHLGDRPHPSVAAGARGMLNKSPNERSGVHSTARSFLSLYEDPVVAAATRQSDFAISDLVCSARPMSLYLVAPPSDKKRLQPLFRLVWNQICTRLTEDLQGAGRRHRLLLVLDEFPSLGKMDFFEEILGYVAGYGIKVLLVSQSYNQIVKHYGATNSIMDNTHVRVYFAPNTEESAERISRALGAATEIHQQKNYAGHRLAPWLGHVMLSDQETARPLMTPGEVMALPAHRELVLVAGKAPIRARKVAFYSDPNFTGRTKVALRAPVILMPVQEAPLHGPLPPLASPESGSPDPRAAEPENSMSPGDLPGDTDDTEQAQQAPQETAPMVPWEAGIEPEPDQNAALINAQLSRGEDYSM